MTEGGGGGNSMLRTVFRLKPSLRRDRFSGTLRKSKSWISMIRLITYSISGLAYLKFMGNECGHPKVEFPMANNGLPFSLAKRDCDLLAREGVHQNLFSFDKTGRFDCLG
ncbi:hypothetical protein L1987_36943 [Smallanthus sonchifolius]|uniref:Uncharacterized protein n=1 Tax=Smallanthus sonchifolius TaxID=185202 RepID=A0ACB9HEZ6_9ASTR|nr:hypothetical protein L1987_36943 [Smallanthus sonchifolius]